MRMAASAAHVPLLLLCALVVCPAAHSEDGMASRVDALVDRVMRPQEQQAAFSQIEALGMPSVPYLVGRLADMRPLPGHQMSLANKDPNSFEAYRHYSPETIHDALSAMLNQITGQHFGFVYNGASAKEREENLAQWRAWRYS